MPKHLTHFEKTAVLVDGETKLLGLIGEGISYTKSPALHNCSARSLGVNSVYVPFDVEAAGIPTLLQCLWDIGALGANITTPHKELVASLVPEHDLESINTIYRGPKGWLGASTDGVGFAAGLDRICAGLKSFRQIVVLGCGGVVLSLVHHIKKYHTGDLEKLQILRRSDRNDERLKELVGEPFPISFGPLSAEELTRSLSGRGSETLLVQGTSAPHHGDRLEHLVPALGEFRGVVCDLVYGKHSALYDTAIALDLVCQDGESMLIEQARASQKHWFGRAATYDELAASLRGK